MPRTMLQQPTKYCLRQSPNDESVHTLTGANLDKFYYFALAALGGRRAAR